MSYQTALKVQHRFKKARGRAGSFAKISAPRLFAVEEGQRSEGAPARSFSRVPEPFQPFHKRPLPEGQS
jgi:hypothetical protein